MLAELARTYQNQAEALKTLTETAVIYRYTLRSELPHLPPEIERAVRQHAFDVERVVEMFEVWLRLSVAELNRLNAELNRERG